MISSPVCLFLLRHPAASFGKRIKNSFIWVVARSDEKLWMFVRKLCSSRQDKNYWRKSRSFLRDVFNSCLKLGDLNCNYELFIANGKENFSQRKALHETLNRDEERGQWLRAAAWWWKHRFWKMFLKLEGGWVMESARVIHWTNLPRSFRHRSTRLRNMSVLNQTRNPRHIDTCNRTLVLNSSSTWDHVEIILHSSRGFPINSTLEPM